MKLLNSLLKDEKRITFALVIYQIALLLFYAGYFGQFFPNKNSALGHDYAYFFPHLLDGYYWFLGNGIFKAPWFSPAFCGGLPQFSNPQDMFYSIPQFLTFAVGPLFGVYITVIMFAWFGYIGTYLLLRRVFSVSYLSSALAATLFLMNGFYFNRMVIGHLAFHSFMLIPLLCYFLMMPIAKQKVNVNKWVVFGFYSVMSSLLLAYMLYSGMLSIMIPLILGVVAVACIYGFTCGCLKSFWQRFVISGIVSLSICSAKLISMLAFVNQFPRDQYKLPGTGIIDGIELFFRSLFLPATWSFSKDIIRHFQWMPQMHDYDFNITPVPLIIIIIGIVYAIRSKKWLAFKEIAFTKWSCAFLLALIFIIPYLFHLYTPLWHQFLKLLPAIKTSSTLIRWHIIYILPLLIIMALFIERTEIFKKYKLLIFIAGVATVFMINIFQPIGYYHNQNYKPFNVLSAYYKNKEHNLNPQITNIAVYADSNGKWVRTFFVNDMIAIGASQMFCYEPILGYRLENFPLKTLQPGSITIEKNGFLNFKNPACYIYPAENNCHPGDHFTVGQKDEMMNFAAYNGYKFNVSLKQTIANWISPIAFILCILYLLFYCGFLATVKFIIAFKKLIAGKI
jgi:hypothetical protein